MINHDDCRCIDDSTDLFMIFFHFHITYLSHPTKLYGRLRS